jgi:KDO2-lipid IV(A) lauroyltransferase
MYRIRNTSDAGLLRKLFQDLRDGYSLLIYIDGNIGTNENKTVPSKSDHLIEVDFLGCPLASRSGFAMLGYQSERPILPVILRRQNGTNFIKYFTPIEAESLGREAFCKLACTNVWSHLARRLKHDSTQWESWRYIDLSYDVSVFKDRFEIVKPIFTSGMPLIFNRQRFVLSDRNDTPILYDRVGYRIIPINKSTYDVLRKFSNGIRYDESDLSFIGQCYDHNILIAQECAQGV